MPLQDQGKLRQQNVRFDYVLLIGTLIIDLVW